MALPTSILWNVRLTTRRRLALASAFALAVITMAISIVRASVLVGVASSNGTSKHIESTWLHSWDFIESCVGQYLSCPSFVPQALTSRNSAILVACLASFRALFTAKDHAQEAKEAAERNIHEAGKDTNQVKLRALKARAKHFQDSLFNTVTSAETPTINRTDLPSNGERHSLPEINTHGLIKDDEKV